MTTGRENVVNKMLGGEEIKSILRADFEKLLEQEGMLSHYIAYGRLGYTISVALHIDNPMRPETFIGIASNKQDKQPRIESAPLMNASPESAVSGSKLDRNITSPNEERLRHGLTLPVVTTGPDGTIQTEQVKYPPSPELGLGDITITDVTKETNEAWKIPAPTV